MPGAFPTNQRQLYTQLGKVHLPSPSARACSQNEPPHNIKEAGAVPSSWPFVWLPATLVRVLAPRWEAG